MSGCTISGGQMTHSIGYVQKTTFTPSGATHGTYLRVEQADTIEPFSPLPEFTVKVAVNGAPLALSPPIPSYSRERTCARRAVEIPMTPNAVIRVTTPTRDETFTATGGDVVAK